MTVLTLAFLSLLAPAIALLVAGWRGRPVDDHPVCRRCRFDLSGAPPGGTNCPECGADVTRPRAVRVGNRVRRWGMLAVAVPLLLVALGPPAMVGWVNVRRMDLTRYKPAAMVIRDVTGADGVMRAALRELTRRVAAGGLNDAQVNNLADRALARQADRSRPWVHRWGEFLEAAHDAGRLDEERWSRYLTEAARFDMVVRPAVRRGDPIPVNVQGGHVRVGRDGRFLVQHAAPAVSALPDVMLGRDPGGAAGPVPLNSGGATGTWSTSAIRPDPATLAKLPDGAHVVQAVVNVTITDAGINGRPFHQVVRLSAPFTLVPADRPSVTVKKDPSVTDQFRRAMSVQAVWSAGGQAHVMMDMGQTQFGQPFRVWLRAGDREWQVDRVLVGGGGSNLLVSGPAAGLDATRVDVVFRPDLHGALETVYVTTMWEGEVVLNDVEVAYPQKQPPTFGPPERP